MVNRILFPFNYKKDNRERYAKTLQMASQINAKVVMFTSIPKDASEIEKEKVYHHLLELNGYFQCFYNGWKKVKTPLIRIIERGDLTEKLMAFLEKENSFTMVMMPASVHQFNQNQADNLLEELYVTPSLMKKSNYN